MKNLILSLVTVLAATAAHAQLQLGTPGYGGTGCPAGTSSIAISPDSNQVAILLDGMILDGTNNNAAFDRKACNIRVPFNIAPGFKVVVTEVLTEGIYNVEPQDGLNVTQEVFMVGAAKRKIDKLDLKGPWDYLNIGDQLVAKPVVVESACGQTSGMIGLAYTALIRKTSVDSTDTYLGIYRSELRLQVVRCQ